MNLWRAIRYPYQNMPKILSMALILGIALVAFGSMIERGEALRSSSAYWNHRGLSLDDLGLSGLFLTLACFMIWLAGYSLDVIRHASRGYRSLPVIDFLGNLGGGLVFWLSRLLWSVVGLILILELFKAAPGRSPAVDLVIVAAGLIFALETVAASVRCAALRQASAALAFPKNLAFLLENRTAFAGLLARLLLLNAVYVMAGNAYVQTMSWIERAFRFDSYLIFIAMFCVGVLIFLFQFMSSLHLVGQFAYMTRPDLDGQPY